MADKKKRGRPPGSGKKKRTAKPSPEKKKKKVGRPPKEAKLEQGTETVVASDQELLSPLDYMIRVFNDPNATQERRDKMAIEAARYCHANGLALPKLGKKEAAKERAKDAASRGKFAKSAPPLSVVDNR